MDVLIFRSGGLRVVEHVILSTQPTSYWPLDDLGGSSCHDEMGLHARRARIFRRAYCPDGRLDGCAYLRAGLTGCG